ncbi:unnamed protein product, partial [Rotaria sp. Silwood1]
KIIDANYNTLIQLPGLIVQAVAGEYTNDEVAINIIKRVCVLSKCVVHRNISIRYWYKNFVFIYLFLFQCNIFTEDQIINHYKACQELNRDLF